jgi:coenzyme F420-0:L-glutamate ligase / coenzyme F420-1:gamma-L-glutamate ligase
VDNLRALAIQSPKIHEFGDSVTNILFQSMEDQKIKFEEGDILVVASKVVSMEEKRGILLADVKVSEKAKKLAEETGIKPEVVELILKESLKIYGYVYKAILTKTTTGLNANAGIDMSNAPHGYALLLPEDPEKSAEKIRLEIEKKYNIYIPVIITDSKTIPLRRGTTGAAIGVSGMTPVIDDRGKDDLYGYKMTISTRGVADNVATVGNLLMGETNERTPFVIVKGVKYIKGEDPEQLSAIMPEDECLYFSPFIKALDVKRYES